MRVVLHFVLFPFSALYGGVMAIRNLAYNRGWFKTYAASVPVISVGNLSMGGTGKTPTAEFIIRTLLAAGKRPAYVSRGYGRKTKGYLRVVPGKTTASQVGDEALQVASKFPGVPVTVCEKRIRGIEKLQTEATFDCVIVDDGFQHRSLHRDLDIVLIDANRPPWRDSVFPAGRLREFYRGIARADFVIVNKLHSRHLIPRWQRRLKTETAYSHLSPLRLVPFGNGPELELSKVREGHFAVAFSAVASNGGFFRELKRIGFRLKDTFGYRDHHRFSAKEIGDIARAYRQLSNVEYLSQQPILITTEKDYHRLKDEPWFATQAAQYPFYYLEVAVSFWDNQAALQKRICAVAGGQVASTPAAATGEVGA